MGGIRFDADGGVTFITGTLDYGQGHATPFAQVLSERLGIPFERIRLLQGDSDELLAGGGTGGSRSMMTSGTAIVEATAKVVEQGKQIASHVLEAAAATSNSRDGRFVIAGTDRAIGIMELAAKLRAGMKLPAGRAAVARRQARQRRPAPSAFPNGCHVGEVEIDPDTGVIEVVKYPRVNDFGTIINPMLVDGQTHGGVVQGIGQALMERRSTTRRASSSPARSWTTPCRAPHDAPNFDVGAPSGAGQDQPARRQGLRRGRLRRLADLGHERGGRRAVGIRHPPHRHAGDAQRGLAGDPRRKERPARNDRTHLRSPRRRPTTRLVAGVSAAHSSAISTCWCCRRCSPS